LGLVWASEWWIMVGEVIMVQQHVEASVQQVDCVALRAYWSTVEMKSETEAGNALAQVAMWVAYLEEMDGEKCYHGLRSLAAKAFEGRSAHVNPAAD
jgi:hypothetical protein